MSLALRSPDLRRTRVAEEAGRVGRQRVDAIEAMETCKAIRRFKPDPVPQELILRVLAAANCAPSPGNSQGWQFVVVCDRETKQRFSDAFYPMLRARWRDDELVDGQPNARMYRGVLELAKNMADVPAFIAVCGLATFQDEQHDPMRLLMTSLYGVTQNLLLAARALGLGTTLTMFHEINEALLKTSLGIPDRARVAALVPIGWPAERFTRVKRHSLDGLVHWDHW